MHTNFKIILILTLLACFHSDITAQHQQDKKINWLKDLEYLQSELPMMHNNLFFQMSKDAFNQGIERLKSIAVTASNEEMAIKIQQLISQLGDSHTNSNFIKLLPALFLPFSTYYYEDGLFIVSGYDVDESILGHKLVSINDISVQTIIDSLRTLYVAENESWHKRNIPYFICNYSILRYFGFVTKEKIYIKIENYYGLQKEITIKAKESVDFDIDDYSHVRYSGRKLRRPYFISIFGHKYLPKDSTYFVIYNKCTGREAQQMEAIQDSMFNIDMMPETCYQLNTQVKNKTDKKAVVPLPYFRHFRDSVFQTITSQPIKKLVFDLSKNSGGSTSQGSLMIEKIARLIDTSVTKVFVIVGRRTFSAGLIHAMELKRFLNATIIGEPTGGKPSFYGGVDSRYLPESCLQIKFSRSHRRTSSNPEISQSSSLIPDVIFPVTFAGLTSGTDPIFEWIMKQ